MTTTVPATRYAAVHRNTDGYPTAEQVSAYLPAGYRVTGHSEGRVWIAGQDNAGWTLDGYVIPRLASGLIYCEEDIVPDTDDTDLLIAGNTPVTAAERGINKVIDCDGDEWIRAEGYWTTVAGTTYATLADLAEEYGPITRALTAEEIDAN